MGSAAIARVYDLEEYKADRIEAMLADMAENDAAIEVDVLEDLIRAYRQGKCSAVFVMGVVRGRL